MNYPRIDQPTEPGWYWYRWHSDAPWRAVKFVGPPEALREHNTSNYLAFMRGEWRGPIQAPTD